MPTHLASLVATLTEGYDRVLPMLFDVVGVARALLVAHRAREELYKPHIGFFFCCQLVVHIVALSMLRLEASRERQTSTLACAATKPQRSPSAFSTATLSPLISSMYSTSA